MAEQNETFVHGTNVIFLKKFFRQKKSAVRETALFRMGMVCLQILPLYPGFPYVLIVKQKRGYENELVRGIFGR